MKIIFDYNRTLFNPDTDALYDGILEMLQRCTKTHELFLVSRNEPARKERFQQLGIKKYFQACFFVEEKTQELFKKIGEGDTRCVAVGDRVNEEIARGNELGFMTIRLRKGAFANEVPQSANERPTEEISDISELEEVLNRVWWHGYHDDRGHRG